MQLITSLNYGSDGYDMVFKRLGFEKLDDENGAEK